MCPYSSNYHGIFAAEMATEFLKKEQIMKSNLVFARLICPVDVLHHGVPLAYMDLLCLELVQEANAWSCRVVAKLGRSALFCTVKTVLCNDTNIKHLAEKYTRCTPGGIIFMPLKLSPVRHET